MKFTKDECHKFWTTESVKNNPLGYLLTESTKQRTEFLLAKFNELEIPKKNSILEIGCNCGRNLSALYNARWKRVSGIEINPKALEFMSYEYPELKKCIFYNNSAEDAIPILSSKKTKIDIVFSMACLMHFHPDEFNIMQLLKNIAQKYIIIMELSQILKIDNPHIWNHNYEKIFANEYWKLIKNEKMDHVFRMNGYSFMVFEKQTIAD